MSEREEFEAWYVEQGFDYQLNFENYYYRDGNVQWMYVGWKAAKESSRKQVEELQARIAMQKARVAMQNEALRTFERNYLRYDFNCRLYYSAHCEPALSATSEDVAAWQEKRDKEVAAKALEEAAKLFDSGDWFARDKLRSLAAELRKNGGK